MSWRGLLDGAASKVDTVTEPAPSRSAGPEALISPGASETDQNGQLPSGAREISVIIPTHNRLPSLRQVLDAVLREDVPLEVVVVDDGSVDGTAAALEKWSAHDPRVAVLTTPPGGQQQARWQGLLHARGRVILLLDDDVVPDAGVVGKHLAAHDGRTDLVLVGYMPVMLPPSPPTSLFATELYANEYEQRCCSYEREPESVLRNLWFGNVSMTKANALRVLGSGHYSFRFRHEDTDIGHRCRGLGLVGEFDRQLRATHYHSRTLDQFIAGSRSEGAGRALLGLRYPGQAESTRLEDVVVGLPWFAALVIRCCRLEPARRGVLAFLVALIRLSAAAGLRCPVFAAARLARRIEHQHGMLQVLAAAKPDGQSTGTAGD